ncbi:hypothetical protein [Nocardia colli]|uniref:hypothetical protein n=1 Tax=Nocardia colli TaxID=2545717 RepID=UPI0035DBBBFF
MTFSEIPIWEYASAIAEAGEAERDFVRAQLYAAQYRIRIHGGEIMTSSVDEACGILGLENPDQVVEVFQAFKDVGAMRWNSEEQVHIELMPAKQYTKLARRPASLPQEPPPGFDGQPRTMYYQKRTANPG